MLVMVAVEVVMEDGRWNVEVGPASIEIFQAIFTSCAIDIHEVVLSSEPRS